MSQQAEGVFKQRVVKDLKRVFGTNVDILPTQERGRKGVPDLVVCLFGESVRIELKVEGEKPTPLQAHRLDRHTAAGGFSFYSTPFRWPEHLEFLKEKYARKKAASK